jgi:phosphoribosylformimino-5-aminoimidazole carboxamide ribotide isomerase
MILLPAIDLLDQQCVRLSQGVFTDKKVYSIDPLEVAKSFENAGASMLHIVDLNAAKGDSNDNEQVIQSIMNHIDIPIQVGGGIRSLEKAERLLSYGVSRVIVGTLAIENKALLKQMIEKFPKRIMVSLDASQGFVAIKGWKEITQISALELCKELASYGIETIVYTDIAKDGMMQGPNFNDYIQLSQETSIQIIASGGVSSLDDLIKLNEIGLYGAIIGKAIYEKKIQLKEAIQCLQNVSSRV